MNSFERFKNKTAIVTGGAQGIGLAIVERLASEGAHVGIFDRDAIVTEAACGSLLAHGKSVEALTGDITSETEVHDIFQSFTTRHRKLDIMVHSAGIVGPTNIKTDMVSTTDFINVCNVNLVGSFIVTKHALAQMKQRNYGRILLIASIAGKEGNAGMACYSASKAGIIGLVKSAGKEFADGDITVNALAPATIRTKMVAAMPEQQVKYMTDRIPKGRCGTVEEAAALACWIVSEEASFNTGFTFDLTGGRAVY
jgi:NAD(P)-dependent dehydrogenase (short-subunit alcohol dehydrogenase family)